MAAEWVVRRVERTVVLSVEKLVERTAELKARM